MNKPNILFIFSDQQRWDTCSCYGQLLETTPNLDQLASEGVLINNAFTCQPVCGPARAALQIGKYPTELGCHINNRKLPLDEKTIAHYLSEAGYETGYLGKWHLASQGKVGGPGDFKTKAVPEHLRGGYKDFWLASDVLEFTSHSYDGHMFDQNNHKREFPKGQYRVDVQTDWLIEYLQTKTSDKPFFMFTSYIEPHHQNDHKHYEGPKGSKEKFKDFQTPGDLLETNGNWKEEYPDYLGCINSLDQNLGRIIDELKKQNLYDNTIIIYTSDHGSHFRTRNSEYKRSCHDSSIRIPMIIHGPGFDNATPIDELVSLIDLPPTILKAAGISPPEYMKGSPIQNIFDENKKDWPSEVFLQISESHCGRAIRTKKWKYSINATEKEGQATGSDTYTEDFLYDLESDPHERINLVKEPSLKDVRKELSKTLKKRMLAVGEKEPEICACLD